MRIRVQSDRFTTLLFAALGLVPLACGGSVASEPVGSGGSSGSSTGGSAGTSGSGGANNAGGNGGHAGNGGNGGTAGNAGNGGTAGNAGSGGAGGVAAGGSGGDAGGPAAGGSGGMGGDGAGGFGAAMGTGGTAGAGTGGAGGTAGASGAGGTAGASGAGGTAGASGAGGTGGSGVDGGTASACVDRAPAVNGYASCTNGRTHRPAKVQCPSLLPRPVAADAGVSDAGHSSASDAGFTCTIGQNCCASDQDCPGPYGHCEASQQGGGTYCATGCVVDSDCASGTICVCGSVIGQCVAASCSVDANCGAGFLCEDYISNPGCPFSQFACQTAQDQCSVDSDCRTGRCGFQEGHRACVNSICSVGRPFLVDGAARLAPRSSGDGWCAPEVGSVTGGSTLTRARLAEEWTQVALMEHASIAAFARFTLQLLALGAPAELVEFSNAAMVDETRHARLAFAVASDFAGANVGPGRLDLQGAIEETSLGEVLIGVIREGCVGETVAAVEASEALEHAEDPAVRAVLARIAEDELGHAELAWKFVQWALERGGDELRRLARREFAAVVRESAHAAARALGADEPELLAGGIVAGALRGELRAFAIERVVVPCAAALGLLEDDVSVAA